MPAVTHVHAKIAAKASSTAHVLIGGAAATLYTDGTGNTPAGDNAVTAGSDGSVTFFASAGDYVVTSVNNAGQSQSAHLSVALAHGGAFQLSTDAPADGDVLVYNATTDEYEPSTALTDVATTVTELAAGQGITLPTADPHVAGELWNNAGTVKVSAGP